MIELTVTLRHYALTPEQLGLLAQESFGNPLTTDDGQTITFGFEDLVHRDAFQHCLTCYRLP